MSRAPGQLARALRAGPHGHVRARLSACSSRRGLLRLGRRRQRATSTCSPGIAVNALGHAPPRSRAGRHGAGRPPSATRPNFFASEPAVALAERLLDLLDGAVRVRVFFCNSGAEAIEAAVKLAPAHRPRRGSSRARASFHGRTMGRSRSPTSPPTASRSRRSPGGRASSRSATPARSPPRSTTTVAAIFLEPVQGEAGVRELPAGYLAARPRADAAARRAARRSTRSRPASAAPATGSPTSRTRRGMRARRRDARQGPGRRLPDRRPRRVRPGRGRRCSGPGSTGRRSAATRSPCAAGLAVLDTSSSATACSANAARWRALRDGVSAHRRRRRGARRGLLRAIELDRIPSRPRWPPRCSRPASSSTPSRPTPSGSRPPLSSRADELRRFLDALPRRPRRAPRRRP